MFSVAYSVVIFIVLAENLGFCRNVPRYADLDEDDRELLRAAYDSPSYETDAYQQEDDDDLKLGKIDLVKDGLWAVKAKLKELKAFDKALVANLLSTKLKVKELLASHIHAPKKHHYDKKPTYNYQAPSYSAPEYYAPPQYDPAPQYPAQQYNHDPYYGH